MTNQQRGIIAVVFAAALLGGALLVFLLVSRGSEQGVSQATTSPEAEVSEAPSASAAPSASLEPSEAPSAAPSASASAAPSASPTAEPTATPTLPPPAPATVVFTQLKLDAQDDPNGHTRRMEWRTAGTGTVKVTVKTTSPRGNVGLCLSRNAHIVDCIVTANGSISSQASATFRDFAMSVIGQGGAAPLVDVTITFPARAPQVTIVRARFDGTDFPDTNGIQVIVHPRRGGDVTLDASWGQPYRYEVDLFEQGGDKRSQQFPNQPAASGVQQTFPITGTNPWKLVLQNIDTGNGVTQMTATIGWP